ncbi:MAG TPA: transcription initiation factor IIB [Methanophagales archaeon]|nr:transcription initiation factor IIB [Methanophagales archaeon]
MSYRIHNKGLSTPTSGLFTRSKRLRGIIAMDSGEKSLSFALGEIDRMASALKLPNDIRETTSLLYRKAARQNLIKGRSIEELVSAMLFITCRQYRVPRTLKEITVVSRMPLKKIRRSYFFLLKKLNIKLPPADPACYIPRFCSELGLSDATRVIAIEIIKKNKGTGTARGWGPTGTAAAAILIATKLSGEYADVKEIAKVAGTTPVTIHNRRKELEKRSKLNTDPHSPYPYQEKGAFFVMAII